MILWHRLAFLALLSAWMAAPASGQVAGVDRDANMTALRNGCRGFALCAAQAMTGPCTTAGFTFIDNDVDFAAPAPADVITETAHGLATGDGPVQVTKSAGAFPGGIVASTNYWIIRVDANTIKLAASKLDAETGVALDLTDAGDDAVTYTVTGQNISADLSGLLRATFYATGSTASDYACQLYSSTTGYHATARGQVTSVGLTDETRVIHYDGPLDRLWAECSTITGGVAAITGEACP